MAFCVHGVIEWTIAHHIVMEAAFQSANWQSKCLEEVGMKYVLINHESDFENLIEISDNSVQFIETNNISCNLDELKLWLQTFPESRPASE
jgi:hypothetical protein